jgi:hypothetical protein
MSKVLSIANISGQVTWDEHSVLVNGKRIMFMSGEFHPFRYVI